MYGKINHIQNMSATFTHVPWWCLRWLTNFFSFTFFLVILCHLPRQMISFSVRVCVCYFLVRKKYTHILFINQIIIQLCICVSLSLENISTVYTHINAVAAIFEFFWQKSPDRVMCHTCQPIPANFCCCCYCSFAHTFSIHDLFCVCI